MNHKMLIGRAEYCNLRTFGCVNVPARIDTGARTSSLWASNIGVNADGLLAFTLFGEGSDFFTGEIITVKDFSSVVVASSNGHAQKRFKIPTVIELKGRRLRTFCTLADRSTQAFPLLIGRNTLRGKFIVDVQKGPAKLDQIDKARFDQLQSLIVGEDH